MTNEQLIDECEALRFASNVYFMKPVGMDGPIKIGVSTEPTTRLLALMAWSPVPLEVMAFGPGNCQLETFLHKKFADQRSHLEWFHPSQELLAGIQRVRAGESVEEVFGAKFHIRIPNSRHPQYPASVMRYCASREVAA